MRFLRGLVRRLSSSFGIRVYMSRVYHIYGLSGLPYRAYGQTRNPNRVRSCREPTDLSKEWPPKILEGSSG